MPATTEAITCAFEDVGGHLILVLGATRALLDTGSPVTLGRQRAWEFLGTPQQLATGFGSITMDGLSDAVGTRVDVLLGTDLLRECAFDIDWPARRVTFAGPPERLAGLPRIGTHRDFYPTIGPFDTPLYRAPLTLGGQAVDLRWGELPDALAPLQLIAAGIVGTELFRQYRVRFDLARETMWLRGV